MPRDAVSRTANAERTGRHKWVKVVLREMNISLWFRLHVAILFLLLFYHMFISYIYICIHIIMYHHIFINFCSDQIVCSYGEFFAYKTFFWPGSKVNRLLYSLDPNLTFV